MFERFPLNSGVLLEYAKTKTFDMTFSGPYEFAFCHISIYENACLAIYFPPGMQIEQVRDDCQLSRTEVMYLNCIVIWKSNTHLRLYNR